MKKKFKVRAAEGLHIQPVTEMVQICQGDPEAQVWLEYGGESVKLDSPMSVLALGIEGGSDIVITVKGGDEKMLLEKIGSLIEKV